MERSWYYAQYRVTYWCAQSGLSIIECLVYLTSMCIILTLVLSHMGTVYRVSRSTKNRVHARQELVLASHELARDIYYGYGCCVDQHKKYGQRLIIMHKTGKSLWYCKNNMLMRAVNKQNITSANVVARGCTRVQFALVQEKLVLYKLEGLHEQEYSAGKVLCSNGVRL